MCWHIHTHTVHTKEGRGSLGAGSGNRVNASYQLAMTFMPARRASGRRALQADVAPLSHPSFLPFPSLVCAPPQGSHSDIWDRKGNGRARLPHMHNDVTRCAITVASHTSYVGKDPLSSALGQSYTNARDKRDGRRERERETHVASLFPALAVGATFMAGS